MHFISLLGALLDPRTCLETAGLSLTCCSLSPPSRSFPITLTCQSDLSDKGILQPACLPQLEATFVGVGPIEDVPKETSWTSQVRIYNPKGRHSVCSVVKG